LETRSVVILARQHGVGKLGHDWYAARRTHFLQGAALGVDRNIRTVFTASAIQGGWHPASLAGRKKGTA
jgi:hypothetical protein